MHRNVKFLLLLLPLLQGCFFTTSSSFNNGTLVRPGNAKATVGFGRHVAQLYRSESPVNSWNSYLATDGYYYSFKKDDSTFHQKSVLLKSVVFDFQLGIASKFPFGNGLNIGLHREMPGYSIGKRLASYPTSELFIKCGLPIQAKSRFNYNQNIVMGWQRGLYVDNGFFVEYAGGFETIKRKIPYFNVRMGFTPTDPLEKGKTIEDIGLDSTFFTYKNKRFFGRVAAGNTFVFKRKRAIVPEINTEAALHIIHKKSIYPTFQVGFTWKSFFNEK